MGLGFGFGLGLGLGSGLGLGLWLGVGLDLGLGLELGLGIWLSSSWIRLRPGRVKAEQRHSLAELLLGDGAWLGAVVSGQGQG